MLNKQGLFEVYLYLHSDQSITMLISVHYPIPFKKDQPINSPDKYRLFKLPISISYNIPCL
jgi:hypothetical protein